MRRSIHRVTIRHIRRHSHTPTQSASRTSPHLLRGTALQLRTHLVRLVVLVEGERLAAHLRGAADLFRLDIVVLDLVDHAGEHFFSGEVIKLTQSNMDAFRVLIVDIGVLVSLIYSLGLSIEDDLF